MVQQFTAITTVGYSEITPSLMCGATATLATERGVLKNLAGSAVEKGVSKARERTARTAQRPESLLTARHVQDVAVMVFGLSPKRTDANAARARAGFGKPAANVTDVASFTVARAHEPQRTCLAKSVGSKGRVPHINTPRRYWDA